MKQILPKIDRGGYSARLQFPDEGRGERYFDTEWDIRRESATRFTIRATMNHRGDVNHDSIIEVIQLASVIKIGDQIVLSPRRWTRAGARWLTSGIITIVETKLDEHKQLLITFRQGMEGQ